MTDYCAKWRMKISTEKSKIMVFGETKAEKPRLQDQRLFTINTVKVQEVNNWLHLGILLNCFFDSFERTTAACRKGKTLVNSMQSIGFRPAQLNPIVCTKLWFSICLPGFLHGCELWNNLGSTEELLLERVHRYAAKLLQGLPTRTHTDVALGMLGWLPLIAQIDICKLKFLGRMIYANDNLCYKKIFLRRLYHNHLRCSGQSLGFIPDIKAILHKYDLFDFLSSFINHQVFPSKPFWKSIVNHTVQTYHADQWQTRLTDIRDIGVVRHMLCDTQPNGLYAYTYKRPSLQNRKVAQTAICILSQPVEDTQCKRCGEMITDAIPHLLMDCQHMTRARNMFWSDISNQFPVELSVKINNLDDEALICAIFGMSADTLFTDPSIWMEFMYISFQFLNALLTYNK